MLRCGSGLQVEVEGMREAHLRSAVALCGLLALLDKEVQLFTACTPKPLFVITSPCTPVLRSPPPTPLPPAPPLAFLEKEVQLQMPCEGSLRLYSPYSCIPVHHDPPCTLLIVAPW